MSDITNFDSHKLSLKVSNNSLDLLINGREGLADCFSLIYNAIGKKVMKTLTVCPKSLPKGAVINTNLMLNGNSNAFQVERFVIGMREIGKVSVVLKIFLGCMNIAPAT